MNLILLKVLKKHLSWKSSKIDCFLGMIISLIKESSINFKNLALGIDGKAKHKSKIQRIYRFFKEQRINYDEISALILSLFKCKKFILAIDRTNWKLGKTHINILYLTIVFEKISIPIYWYQLDRAGACNSNQMKEILNRFIDKFGLNKIEYLLADREFMNQDLLNFLITKGISFAIPLKKNCLIKLKGDKSLKTVGNCFNDVQQKTYENNEAILWGHTIKISAYRNDKG